MKKILITTILLTSFSCFSLLEKSLDRMENKMDEAVNNCKPICTDYKISENEWCDCMYSCLNKNKMKWKISECESDLMNQN